MSLLGANKFKVTKTVEFHGIPTVRLDFQDLSKVLLGCSLNQKGVNEVVLRDQNELEILRLQGIRGRDLTTTALIGLFDSSGNMIAELKSDKSGAFSYPNLTWQKDGLALLTYRHKMDKIYLSRENKVLATIHVKATFFSSFGSFEVSVDPGDAVVAGSGSGSSVQNISTTYTYNFNTGTMSYKTDPNDQTTFYSYDHLGRLTQVDYPTVNGVPAATSYTYNDTGNYVTTTDPNGNNVTNYYDGLGRLISVVTYNGTSIYSEVNYTYNYLNLVSQKMTALGNTYKYSYDALGSLIKVTNPDNTTISYSYNYQNNTKTMIDENGHKTQYAYDWNNNLLWVRQWNSSTSYYQTSYSYDLSGNLLSVTDANSQVTHYSYDNLNPLISTSYPDGTAQTMTYDNVGNLLSFTDGMHNTTYYSYDALNRLVNITNPDHSTVVYSYDKNGNRISKVDSATTSYYTYDARNRLANETDIMNGTAYTVRYSYDRASNILSILYPDNFNLTYSYDALERVARVGSYATFTYTKDGQIATIAYGDGVKTNYTYNSRDMPTSMRSVNGTTTLLDLNYTYDGVGNVLSINNQPYSYDALNRMISGNGTWGSLVYKYDAVGNILQVINGSTATNYSYGSYNRLLSAGNVNYTYNNDGDIVTKTTSSGTWNYYYNPLNELTSVALNGVSMENNTYNGDGQRIKSTTGSSSLTFMYQGTNLLYEKNLTSNVVTKRIFANGIVISELVGTSLDYYLTDALGSVRLVLGGGSSIFSSNYAPFGSNAALSGFELLQYAERPLDESTGLYYMTSRYYDPSTGRFITEDTYAGKKSDPSSLNRYVYAQDNPMRYIDPTGHRIAVPNSNGGYTVLPTNPYTSPSQVISEYKNFVASQNNVGSISSNTITTNTGGGGTTTNIAPTPTDLFVYWFFQDWLPTHESELALALVSIGLDVIGMSDVSAIIASLSKSALNAIVESITASGTSVS